MNRICIPIICCCLLSLIGLGESRCLGLQTRQDPTTANSQDAGQQPSAEFVGLERAFPSLRFDRPVYLTGAGDLSGRLFVVEQAGVVRWFSQTEEQPDSQIFLDIRDRVSRRGNEEGLIGFAFDPDFKHNGWVYCHFSSDRDRKDNRAVAPNILARYRISRDNPNAVDVGSEEVILKVDQPYANHNGGALEFGPDGYLYLALGDGGHRDDPHGNGQNLSTWLGSILRIDVHSDDQTKPYAIPSDNPFVDTPDARPEIFALGLRNVWRFSFDRKTGELWGADVGQDSFEEVNIIHKGGNYGWNRYEADADFKKDTPLAIAGHQPPIASYGREWGGSITGGYVYRGKRFPSLDGSYFFGDYMTGNLWRTRKSAEEKYQTELVRRTGRSIASFGEDDDGEVFLLSFDGGIYRIVPTDQPENTFEDWPTKLSETGLFTSTKEKKIADHLTAYEVNAPFWSDHAEKSRYFSLPKGSALGFRPEGSWEVPVGTTIVKNFQQDLGRRGKKMLETRLIKRTADGWEAATYVWDARDADAELLPNGKQFETYGRQGVASWHAPSSSECASCHVDASGYVLGFTTAQLNRVNPDETTNQITQWAAQGLLEIPADLDLESANRFCSPYDESEDVGTRARVWLDVNCAMCHQPTGPGNANIDLRFETPLEKTKTLGVQPAQGHLGIADAELIAAGAPERSLMVHRIETLSEGRMPSIGSNQVDKEAVKLLSEWIKSLK